MEKAKDVWINETKFISHMAKGHAEDKLEKF
jgi:hypothetical protein